MNLADKLLLLDSHLITVGTNNLLVGSLDATKSLGDLLRLVHGEMNSGEKLSRGNKSLWMLGPTVTCRVLQSLLLRLYTFATFSLLDTHKKVSLY